MTQLQAVRKFAAEVAEQKVIIARQRVHNNWAMCVDLFSDEIRMKIPDNPLITGLIPGGVINIWKLRFII